MILVGDPREIVPVVDKPLNSLEQYFTVERDESIENDLGIRVLISREQRGYKIYASSRFHASLAESVKLKNRFAYLNILAV